jgi:hypothetical protein
MLAFLIWLIWLFQQSHSSLIGTKQASGETRFSDDANAATIEAAGQIAHVLHDMTKHRGAWRAKTHMVHVAVPPQGQHV